MNETEIQAVSFQGDLHRPRPEEIIITFDDGNRRAEFLDFFPDPTSADIAEMPNLISHCDLGTKRLGEKIVRVSDDGDPKWG